MSEILLSREHIAMHMNENVNDLPLPQYKHKSMYDASHI